MTRTIRTDVKWILNRIHVLTSYQIVATDISDRCGDRFGQQARAHAITDAVIQHRRNRLDYAWVMGPH